MFNHFCVRKPIVFFHGHSCISRAQFSKLLNIVVEIQHKAILCSFLSEPIFPLGLSNLELRHWQKYEHRQSVDFITTSCYLYYVHLKVKAANVSQPEFFTAL